MKEAEIKKVAIYARVSTTEQIEGYSIENQLSSLRNYCKARSWEIYKEYIDPGVSGTSEKRRAYQEMLKEVSQFDAILVYKMDRCHRNSKNFMSMMDFLEDNNCGFVSITESLDTKTAMGRFCVDIIQRIAQLESETTGERVLAGMSTKAKTEEGAYLGSPIPYGFSLKNKKLVINEEEAKVIKIIFGLYTDKNYFMKKIVKYLNEQKIPTRRNRKWTLQSIAYILRNPIYTGVLHWKGIERKENFPKIIEESVFEKAAEIRKSRKPKPKN